MNNGGITWVDGICGRSCAAEKGKIVAMGFGFSPLLFFFLLFCFLPGVPSLAERNHSYLSEEDRSSKALLFCPLDFAV